MLSSAGRRKEAHKAFPLRGRWTPARGRTDEVDAAEGNKPLFYTATSHLISQRKR